MSRRLRIARRLLSDKGVIFVSIDEKEIASLRLLGDEIFLETNFVGQWNWFKSATPPALSKKIKRTTEYILCWTHQNNDLTFRGVQKVSKSNDPFTKPQNSYKILTFPPYSINCSSIKNGIIEAGVYGTNKFPNELLDNIVVKEGKNTNSVRFRNRFIWKQDTLNENISNGLYIELSKNGVLSYKRKEYNKEVPPNLINEAVGVDTTENAGRMLLDIFNGNKVFDYPKPVSLIKYLVNFIDTRNLTILDFFAGSGTTLHATMQLNAEDGGHRKCILVTNNENGICENVTYERNKRVIQGYTTPKSEDVPGLTANTLRYYKTDFISRDRTQRNMHALVEAATDLLCIKEDLYEEKTHFGQYKTHPKVLRYFAQGNKRMLILYRDEYTEEVAAEVERIHLPQGEKFKVYIFSPDRYAYDDIFQDVAEKVTLVALPAAIYDAYKKVLPKRREKLLELQTDHNEANEEGGEQ